MKSETLSGRVLALFGKKKMKNLEKIAWYKNKWVRLFFALTLFVLYAVTVSYFLTTACPFSLLTGFPCPACGMTRANILALKLQFSAAFEMHPLFFFSIVLVGLLIVNTANPEIFKKTALKVFCLISIALFFGVYIYRMIAFYPNKEPMMYNFDSLLGVILKALGVGGG